MKRRMVVSGSAILLVLLAYLTLWPVPIDPRPWDAPSDPGYTGDFKPNQRLDELELIPLGPEGHGPEDAVTGPDGRIYASLRDGTVVALSNGTAAPEVMASTDGKPLGLEFGPDGRLYIADAYRGLLVTDVDGGGRGPLITLAERDGSGNPLKYVDDLDVAADGVVYFSDASSKFGAREWGGTFPASLLDLIEHGGHGRLLRYDPAAKANARVMTVIDGLNFANGVALAADGSFVLIGETGHYRVLKHWLAGPKAGQTEPLLSNLPGFPDNLNRASDGTYWLGLISPRSRALDGLSGWPGLRKLVQRLPKFLRPSEQLYGCVVRFDAAGQVLETWQSPQGSYGLTTGAAEGPGGTTLVTSLRESRLGLMR